MNYFASSSGELTPERLKHKLPAQSNKYCKFVKTKYHDCNRIKEKIDRENQSNAK